MITKTKSEKKSPGKLFLIIPFIFAILIISSCLKNPDKEITEPADKENSEKEIVNNNNQPDSEKDKPFFIVEEMPIFQDGTEENSIQMFRREIMKNLKYPAIAMENGIEGTVFTSFVIGDDGKIEDIKILRGVDPALDAEAIKTIKAAPKWQPGKQKGKKVRVAMSLPIKFILDPGKESSNKAPNKDNNIVVSGTPGKSENKEFKKYLNEDLKDEQVFVIVEDMPEFQDGGENSLQKFRNYIMKNLKYPAIAMENGIGGTVFMAFVIDETGEVSNVKVIKSVDPALDEEAKRVFKDLPKWTPGEQRGRKIKVAMVLPIKFALQ